MSPGPAAGPGISFEKMAGKKKPGKKTAAKKEPHSGAAARFQQLPGQQKKAGAVYDPDRMAPARSYFDAVKKSAAAKDLVQGPFDSAKKALGPYDTGPPGSNEVRGALARTRSDLGSAAYQAAGRFHHLEEKRKQYNRLGEANDFAQHLDQPQTRSSSAISALKGDKDLTIIRGKPSASGRDPYLPPPRPGPTAKPRLLPTPHGTRKPQLIPNVTPKNDYGHPVVTSAQELAGMKKKTNFEKLKGEASKKQVLWSDEKLAGKKKASDEKLAGPINPDSLDTKKRKVDDIFNRGQGQMNLTREDKVIGPKLKPGQGQMNATMQQMQTVARDKAGRNKNVNYSSVGRALDPFTNESLEKGRPVAAQSMSPLAQGARQFSQSVDDLFLPKRGKKVTVSKQKLAGKKGDEGLPFVPKAKRKAGMGDEGMPLAKKAAKKKGKM